MFILGEGRDAFNKFMTTVLAQILFGGISLLVLYRAVQLPIEFRTFVFYGFTSFLWALFALWIVCSYKDFVGAFQNYIKSKLPTVVKTSDKIMVMDIWDIDRKIAIEYCFIITLTIGVLVFVFFGSALSAVQIAESIKMK